VVEWTDIEVEAESEREVEDGTWGEMEDVEGTERAPDVVEVTVAGTSSEEVDAVEDTVRSAFMSTSATGLMGGKAGKAVGPTFEQTWFACTNMG
jgi:hypothetical protein